MRQIYLSLELAWSQQQSTIKEKPVQSCDMHMPRANT